MPARRLIPLIAALASLAVILVGPPGADAKRKTFTGTCTMGGTVTFSPGLTGQNKQQDQKVDFSGTCNASAATLTGTVRGTAGCTGATGPATDRGTLTVGGVAIPVKLTLDAKLPNGDLKLEGLRSGLVQGSVAFFNLDNLGQMGKCLGKGLDIVKASTTLRTSREIVSGKNKKKKRKKNRRRN